MAEQCVGTIFELVKLGNKEALELTLNQISDAEQRFALLSQKDEEEYTPLHQAARYNENADAMTAILNTVNIEQRMTLLSMKETIGNTPLHLAFYYNKNPDAANKLLNTLTTKQKITLLDMKNKGVETPLHLALASSKDANSTRELLESLNTELRNTLLSMKGDRDYTPLHLAARYNESDKVVTTILDTMNTKERTLFLSMKTYDAYTPLHDAARFNQNADVLTALLDTLNTEQRLTFLSMKDKDEYTPLHLAARFNENEKVMTALLDTLNTEQKITLLRMKNELDYTPLHLAASYNESDKVVTALLERLNTEQILTLLSMKVKLDYTPLHLAARFNQGADVMTALLETVNTEQRLTLLSMKVKLDYTPLHLAAEFNKSHKVMTALLDTLSAEQKIDLLSMKNKGGRTPLHLAAWYNKGNDVISTMLDTLNIEQRMTLVNMNDADGETLLELASQYNQKVDVMSQILTKQDREQRMRILSMLETSNSDSLTTQLLDYLTDQAERKDHILTWLYREDNNLFHLAARVGHTNFIRKAITTQDLEEKNQALVKRNSKGFIPYYCAKAIAPQRLLAWAETQTGCYSLLTPPRIVIFFSDKHRPSAKDEKDSLIRILPEFSMEPVVKLNPTEDEIFSIIRENQEGEVSALIVVMMSHGDSGVVNVKDKQMKINNILKQMNSTKLKDTPKILIIQACQAQDLSDNHHDGVPPSHDGKHQHTVSLDSLTLSSSQVDSSPLPNHAERQRQIEMKRSGNRHFDVSGPNMMVISATINKQIAATNLMIPLLARNLEQSKQDEDLYSVFLKTADSLKRDVPEQNPELRSTMRHKICLRKIYKEEIKYKSSVSLTIPQKVKRLF